MRRAACEYSASTCWSPRISPRVSACFTREKDARKALSDIARASQLCLKVLGLEESDGSCFALQVGKCRGACVGKEPLILHAMRLKLALVRAENQKLAVSRPHRAARARNRSLFAGWHARRRISRARSLDVSRVRALRRGTRVLELSVRPNPRSMSMCTRSCSAISRIIPTSTGMTCAPPKPPPALSMNDNVRYWVATAPVGAASVLAEELAQFGAEDIRERSHDVKFQGTLEVGYRACLWSRTATRVLLSLGSIDATSSKSVYEAVKRIDWREHLAPGATLACDCSGGNESIRHTIYGSQLLKDAVCDNLRESTGERPNIKPERPDVLLHLHVEGPTALVSLDFSGESLHRRGYRSEGGRAPLKENVAAAVLLRAGWPQIAEAGRNTARPHVRFRHFSDRRRLDRCGCGAGDRSRVLRVPEVAWPRCRALGALACGSAGTAFRARGAALHLGVRHRLRSGADGHCQRRPSRRRGLAARGKARTQRSAAAKGGDGVDRRESALWRKNRGGIGIAGAVLRTRHRAARSISGLAGRDSHRQSAAGPQFGHLRQAHAPRIQRHHRVPVAALRSERSQRAASR